MDTGYRLDRRQATSVLAAVVAVAVGIILFTRYGYHGRLTRDQAIYAYGGQQLTHGIAPYASIFDPKTPLATMLSGIGAALAPVVGLHQLTGIRMIFGVFACATVLAVYVLAARVWRSALAGFAAAVVFASFTAWARDAFSGPDAKTPGIFFAVLSMELLARRNWFWAGIAGSFALLVWQPLVIYPALAVLLPLALAPGRRLRSAASGLVGAAVPLIACGLYFVAVGAFGKFVESAIVFPLTGVHRVHETVGQRWDRIVAVVEQFYGVSGVLLWIGLIALVLAAVVLVAVRRRAGLAHPAVAVVLISGLFEMAYALTDFQGAPDVYPLLPYGAVGIAVAVPAGALALSRLRGGPAERGARLGLSAAVALALAVLVGFCWSWYSDAADHRLNGQLAKARCVQNLVAPGTTFYALGSPILLVLNEQRNPSRYIYLGSGVAQWKIAHTRGGFAGWVRQIRSANPSVVDLHGNWAPSLNKRMAVALRTSGFKGRHVAGYFVRVDRGAAEVLHTRRMGNQAAGCGRAGSA